MFVDLTPEGRPPGGVVSGQAGYLPHGGGCGHGVVYPRHSQHVGDGGDASPLLAHQSSLGPVQEELCRGELPGAELVLQFVDLDIIEPAGVCPCLEEEHAQLAVALRPGQSEADVAIRGGAEPLVAVQCVEVVFLVDSHSLRGP